MERIKSPVFIIGITRSGTTILHDMVMKACPEAVDLTSDDDFECRNFWQEFGLTIGSRRTGTYCGCVTEADIEDISRKKIQKYVSSRHRLGGIITKNPHLLNKISYVASILPDAKFVLIVRNILGVVASEKIGFNNAFEGDEDSTPYVHYWPDTNLPCWSYVKMDMVESKVTKLGLVQQLKALVKRILIDLKNKSLSEPSKVLPHINYSEFVIKYPDKSRYYPGEGFQRIPESWLTLNLNAINQLKKLDKSRWMAISYADLVNNTKDVVSNVLSFGGYEASAIDLLPEQLNHNSADKWRENLTEKEQEVVRSFVKDNRKKFDTICNIVGSRMLVDK
jgi:hypothetical protein